MTALTPDDFLTHDTSVAAPGVAQLDVEAVNRKDRQQLYAARPAIHPRRAKGTFRTIKWLVTAVTLTIYYVLPWLRWNRGPDLPDQAVLLDFPTNRYFFFFLEIWPQEFYFITGLLILAALGLFLVTSLAGRVWCGYTCPQTVWTDLMIATERFWQGDRNERLRLDRAPWGGRKIFLKGMTHLSWLAIAIATGGAFVFYFRDAPTLAEELVTGTAPAIAYLFLGLFTATTYLLGGLAREQVCIYMCPWPRIQGAMTDRHTLLVGYDERRGEPRGAHKKSESWEGRGDCIDCKACIAVCPTGIDIRDGSQLECIQCALCIDACNDIMRKVGRPPNLIAYDTIAHQDARRLGVGSGSARLVRPRTLIYAGLLVVVASLLLVAWLRRTVLEINVLAEHNPPYVQLSDGTVRNAYTVKVLNKRHEPRTFVLQPSGIAGATIAVIGAEATDGATIRVATDAVREVRVLVTVPAVEVRRLTELSVPLSLVLRDVASGDTSPRKTRFQVPPKVREVTQ